MTSSETTLTTLRLQIDRIDDQIHDLIMARTALVERVGIVKGDDGLALRPGREARIIRRLVQRHAGDFPRAALIRVWREIIGALTGLQRPLVVAVAQMDGASNLTEVARNHFGIICPVTAHPSSGQVVRLVAEGKATVGLVPVPGHGPDNADPWWAGLAAGRESGPRVVGRLPFCPPDPGPGGRSEMTEALMVAACPHDDTGEDRTLLVIEVEAGTSRDRVRALVTAAGFDPIELLGQHAVGTTLLHLVDVPGWVALDDPRLTAMVREPVRHANVIGGYPLPLPNAPTVPHP
jgi:chorismate mutase / prephenate dehydratase